MGPTSIPVARLRELLAYDQASGVFTWRVRRGNRVAGVEAGTVNGRGYRRFNVEGVSLAAHRAAWAWMTGEWPSADIDHRDGDTTHNAWANLRLASKSQNQANARLSMSNTSGFKGVSRASGGRWRAGIWHDGARQHLGTFDDPGRAHEAYLRRAREIRDPAFVRAA